MELTYEQLEKLMPKALYIPTYLPFLNKWMPLYGITIKPRICHFLSQVAHESCQLNVVQENLNYSVQGLLSTFPTHFNLETAKQYARRPIEIANHIYANRNGNGNEKSGDGWKYRGRGAIQLTFKDNYRLSGQDWGVDLVSHPELLALPENIIRSACWFWWKNGLNHLVDDGATVEEITRKVNGGRNGLSERKAYYEKALRIF